MILVLVILRLAASARHLVHVKRVDTLAEQVGACARLTDRARLTDIALLSRLGDAAAHLARLHVWTVAELALFVLEVGVIGRIRLGRSKVIVAPHDVVVRRGGRRQPEIILVGQVASHAESLRAHLCRVETRIDTSELSRAIGESLGAGWLLIKPLVYLLLRIDVKLVGLIADHVVVGGRSSTLACS